MKSITNYSPNTLLSDINTFLERFNSSPKTQIWWILALIPVVYVPISRVLAYAHKISPVAAYQILYHVRIQLEIII